jgi:hypothetical protein
MIYYGRMQRQISENQVLWAIIAVVIGVDALWAWSIGIRVTFNLAAISAFFVFVALNLVYATVRPNPLIAVFAATIAQLIAFMASGVVLSYLALTPKFPLVDRYLGAADAAMGLDWPWLFTWVREHQEIARVLDLSYGTGLYQMLILMMLLPALGRLDRLREFLWLFVLATLITIPLSALMPAAGAWAHYGVSHLTSNYYLPDFYALRSGEMHEIAMTKIPGIIQLPSFHASVALMLIYVTRGISYLFPISCLLNVLMIGSAPVYGGHHFMDVFAGLAVLPLAIVILRAWQREPSERLVVAFDSMCPIRD